MVFRRNVLSPQPAPRPKILSVSKDKLLVNIRNSILGRVGYTVTAAENAKEAMLKLASQSFDLLILCHTMRPSEKKLLQSESRAKKIPVLSITDGCPPPEIKSEVGKLDDAQGFLAKVKALAPPANWVPVRNRMIRPRYDA